MEGGGRFEFLYECLADLIICDCHLGRLEGVLWREVQVEEEDAALVHRPGRAQDRRHPLVDVVTLRTGAV